jgi:hypothetical protein
MLKNRKANIYAAADDRINMRTNTNRSFSRTWKTASALDLELFKVFVFFCFFYLVNTSTYSLSRFDWLLLCSFGISFCFKHRANSRSSIVLDFKLDNELPDYFSISSGTSNNDKHGNYLFFYLVKHNRCSIYDDNTRSEKVNNASVWKA